MSRRDGDGGHLLVPALGALRAGKAEEGDHVTSDAAPTAGAYLTRRDAAARCRVSVSTFDRLRRQQRVPLPDAEVGRHVLWNSVTIDRFLEAGGTRGEDVG